MKYMVEGMAGLRLCACAAVLVCLVGGFAPGSAIACDLVLGNWSEPVQISTDSLLSVASDGQGTYLAGMESLVYSTDSGSTWNSVPGTYGRLFADDGLLYKVSMPLGEYYVATLQFSMSTDDGVTWSPGVDVITLSGRNDGSFGISKADGRLLVYTFDGEPGTDEIGASLKVIWSDDVGATWSEPVVIAERIYITDPAPNNMAYIDGRLLIAFSHMLSDYTTVNILVASSSDMGESWGTETVATGMWLHDPVIVADPATGETYVTYVGWKDAGDLTAIQGRIFFTKSTGLGSWTEPIEIGTVTNSNDPVGLHSLVASDGTLFEAYLDCKILESGYTYTIRISCSTDDGITWQDLGDVMGTGTNGIRPLLIMGSNVLHMFWLDLGTGDWTNPTTPTYYRQMSLDLLSTGQLTVTRNGGKLVMDLRTLTYSPDKDGTWWADIKSNGLSAVKVELLDATDGAKLVINNENVVFGAGRTGQMQSTPVHLSAGHDYVLQFTPIGMKGASADVTGLFQYAGA